MKKYCLLFDDKTMKLEQKNMWAMASDNAYQQWKAKPHELNCLLCAGLELWYALLEIDDEKLSLYPQESYVPKVDDEIQERLLEITQYGCNEFIGDSVFNIYFGYMISVMPIYFLYRDADYIETKETGTRMIARAYELDPENPFVQAVYYNSVYSGEDTYDPRYNSACQKIWQTITPEQWGYSSISRYFFMILNGNRYYPNAYVGS